MLTTPLRALTLLAVLVASAAGQGTVSVYCSLDQEFSDRILRDFERETGITVDVLPDTEANKTVGLVNRIISERDNPRCDVYWNNELGQTIRLKNEGLLQPYVSPSAEGIPAAFRDPEGYWTGFAARARVIIYNTELIGDGPKPTGIRDLVDPRWAGRRGLAKPLTGTTLTHFAALFAIWGEAEAKSFARNVAEADTIFEGGNAMVMKAVAAGTYAWGYTDTDDANVAREKGWPTDIIVPDQGPDDMGTLLIPNSIAMIKGARNVENARRFIDYVLSPEVELRLAESRSAQIPLHAGVTAPEGVLDLAAIKTMEVDWEGVGRAIAQQNDWLKTTFESPGETPGSKARWVLIAAIVGFLVAFAVFVLRRRS